MSYGFWLRTVRYIRDIGFRMLRYYCHVSGLFIGGVLLSRCVNQTDFNWIDYSLFTLSIALLFV